MPVFHITSPDGAVYEVNAPDGATENDAIAYAQQQHGTPNLTPPIKSGEFAGNQTDKNTGDTYYEGKDIASKQDLLAPASKLSRFYQGVKDTPEGIAQLALHALPDKGLLKGSADYLDAQLARNEAQYQEARKATGNDGVDWMRLGGNITGQAPLMALAPGGGTTLLGRGAAGAITGAALNSANPVVDGKQDFWSSKGSQAGTGAVVGGALSPASEIASRIIKPNVSSDVQTLMKEGVNPTMGQILGGFYKTAEDKATSIPLLGDLINSARRGSVEDLNKAVINRSQAPIGQSVSESGNSGIASAKDNLSKAYDEVLPNLTLQPTQDFATGIGKIRKTIRPALANDYDEILKTTILGRLENGQLSGQMLKDAESDLSKMVKNYTTSSNSAERELGGKLRETLNTFRATLVNQNPEFAPQLQNINKGYSNFKIVEKAANKDINGGVFSPAQLQQSVRENGGTRFASGQAPMQDLSQAAQNVMGGVYPDSGTAGRALWAGLYGGAAYAHPVGAGVAALSALPYTNIGRKVAATLLTKRPEGAEQIANFLRSLPSPIGGNVIYPLLTGGK